MLRQRHQLFVALFVLADALVVVGACYLAWAVRRQTVEGGFPESWREFLREPMALVVVPTILGGLWLTGMYRPRRNQPMWIEQGQLIRALAISLAVLVLGLWAVSSTLVVGGDDAEARQASLLAGRVQIGTLGVTLLVGLSALRLTLRRILRAVRRRGRNLRHVAIIGTGRLGQIVCRTLSRNNWTGLHVAYFISHEDTTDREACVNRPVRGGLDSLEEVLERRQIDGVYLALPNAEAARLPGLLKRLERFALDVRIVPDVPLRYLPHRMAVSELEGMPVLSYRESPLYGLGGVTKRAVDVLGSLAALVLFGPIMLLIAGLVRMSSAGPIIFKQRRVSLGGEEFWIYKFRTMFHVEDESGVSAPTDPRQAWTPRNDPRITPIGRFLRRTSLDELPQLFNVLRGQMSLVGPRPERPELIERFKEDWRGYMLRQHVKAGMTGWAQVNGLRGATDLRKRLQLDLFYIRHWSLGFDLKILWLTLFRGFVHRNAH
ncbi:MAG: undecaprenyl-phosphate glucose phosphotransferase [Phycisphaeraceae bacterium]|nr:undecaprenyl-phosphate glucose phosphotransferase [Phycisphaeraceae bacterium]